MSSGFVALTIFFIFSLFLPFSMILTSILMRKRTRSNPVSRSSYESAEQSVGARISIMNEYIHYFSMFIAFEVVVVIVVLWVIAAPLISVASSAIVLSVLVISFIFEMLVLMLAKVEG